MKFTHGLKVLIPTLFLMLAPLSMTAFASGDTKAKATASSHAKGDHGAAVHDDKAEPHAEEKSGGIPMGFIILIVLVVVVGVAPGYHRLNVGEGDGADGADGAH